MTTDTALIRTEQYLKRADVLQATHYFCNAKRGDICQIRDMPTVPCGESIVPG